MFHSLNLDILFVWCRSRRSRMTLSITSKRLTQTLILKRTLTSMMKSTLKISQKLLLGQLQVRDYWNLIVTRLTFAFVFQVKPAIATKQRVAHLHLAVPPLQSHLRPWIINRERDLPQRRRAMPRLPRQTIRMNGEREPTDPLPMNPTLKHPPLPRSSRLLSKRKSFKLLPANHRQVCALYASSRTGRLNFSLSFIFKVSHTTPNNSSPSSGPATTNHVNPPTPSTQQVNGLGKTITFFKSKRQDKSLTCLYCSI